MQTLVPSFALSLRPDLCLSATPVQRLRAQPGALSLVPSREEAGAPVGRPCSLCGAVGCRPSVLWGPPPSHACLVSCG